MFEKSDSIAKLAEALSKAQGEIEGAKKDSENPFFKSKYADLASVWEACREPLSKNGLSVSQFPVESESPGITLVTVLMHSSGEYIISSYSVPCKPDAQNVGLALTYMRRYALAAAVGIYAEDDDGNAASQNITQATTTTKRPPQHDPATKTPPSKPTPPPAEPVVPMSQQAPLPAAVMTVRDLIAELAPGFNLSEDSLLKSINETGKGQAYLTSKGKPLGFGTELAPSTYDAIKGQVLAALKQGGE
jgi:hypothetical protein